MNESVVDNVYRSVLLCRLAGLGFAETKRIVYTVFGKTVPKSILKSWYYGRRKHRLSRLNAVDKSLFYHKAYEMALEGAEHPEWGHKRVAAELGKRLPIRVPPMTVYYWITGRSRPNVTPVRVVPELGYLAGVLVGDYRRTGGGLKAKDRGFIEYYVKAYEKVTGTRLKIHREYDPRYNSTYYYTKENGGFMKTLWKTGLWKTIAYIYPTEFLQGLFDSEGYISSPTSPSLKISFTTSNLDTLNTAITLLYTQGYRTKIYKDRHKNKNNKSNKIYEVYIIKPRSYLEKFANEIGFRESKRKRRLLALLGAKK